MTQGPHHQDDSRDSAARIPPSQSSDTQYNWRIHHPFEDVEHRVAVEVAPWKGLLPRWRFVIPGDFKGVSRWGVGPAGSGQIDENVKRPVKDGPIQMPNGPLVVWFGGHESLSTTQSAFLVFEGEAPHYIAFGQSESVGGPPASLEGVSFGNDHPSHPHDHDHAHHPSDADEGHNHIQHDH